MSFCIRLNYFHKFKGHFVILQAIINSNKQLLDVFVGLPWSVNDSHTFKQSSLYQKNFIWWFIQFASDTITWKQLSIIYVFESFKTWLCFGKFLSVFLIKKMMNQRYIWLKQIQFNATLNFQWLILVLTSLKFVSHHTLTYCLHGNHSFTQVEKP